MTTPADSAARTLAALGRRIPTSTLADEIAGLQGLDQDQARSVLLASYGVESDGHAGSQFVPDRSGWQSIGSILAQGRPAIVYVMIAALAGLLPAVAVPLLLRIFVDRYLVAGDTSWATPVIVGLLGAALVSAGVVALQYAVLRRFVIRLSKTGQVGFTWHVLNMRTADVTRFGAGELVARSNARQRLSYQGGMMLPLAGVNVLNAVVFSLALLVLNLALGLAALTVATASVVVSLAILRWRKGLQQMSDDDLVDLTSVTADVVGSIESIKAASWEQFAFSRWARHRKMTARSLSRLGVATQWVSLVPSTATALGLGAVLGVGCILVIQGTISLGTVVAAQAFAVLLLESLAMLVWFGVLFQSVASAAQQTDALMSTPVDPEVILLADRVTAPGGAAAAVPPAPLTGTLAIVDLTFGYDRTAPALIAGLTLDIPAGSRLALVGSSGSGKTTIARLAIGELRPWSGVVTLDGTPRLQVPREVRSRDVAYVPQDSVLFPGTLRDNLTMWDDSVTDDQLRQAAHDACIDEAILTRAGGFYATVTGRDSGFSGGEMQRLAIARALVNDPAVLVLDEATSALDPVVEAQVEANLRRRGCTCLVVAHRLSTIRDADEILVIDGGAVVQRGRFDDIKTHGFFSELIHG